ncbi:hypothetical protein BDN72DRAFT_836765 [Pluteus cervinus]|uniref:Uncharacterized protein n=1 Tax=Pluteus cervinus TaxID=181527 RepID=A0ACD3B283_9AGAR|nr:hypothetical protein BDN72DRAFT_836765 [Pluteus cervinus]
MTELKMEDYHGGSLPLEVTVPLAGLSWDFVRVTSVFEAMTPIELQNMKSVIEYSPAHRVGLKPQVITQTVDQHGRRLIPLQWSTLVNACLTYDEFSSIFSRLADRTIRYLTQFHSGIHSSGTRPTREVFAEKAREAQRGLERLRWVQPLSEAAALAQPGEMARGVVAWHMGRIRSAIEELTKEREKSGEEGGEVRATWEDLPTEVQWQIFEHLEPVHTPGDQVLVKEFVQARYMLSQLSLVSKAWAERTPPVLYRHIVIFANPGSVNNLRQSLTKFGLYVRRLTIDDVSNQGISSIHIRHCQPYIERCLQLTTNLVKVESFGDYQLFDGDRARWSLGSEEQYTNNSVPSTIRELTVQCPQWLGLNISSIFRPLRLQLTTLTLIDWGTEGDNFTIDNDIMFPSLTSLTLENGSPATPYINKLIQSTQHLEGTGRGNSSLTKLALINLKNLPELDISNIIQPLGTRLTSLRVSLPHHGINSDPEVSLHILALCPNLHEFWFGSITPLRIFDALPPSLEILGLAMYLPLPELDDATPKEIHIQHYQDFLPYIKSEKGTRLRELDITRRVYVSHQSRPSIAVRLQVYRPDDSYMTLRVACEKRGIRFRSCFGVRSQL